MKLPNDELMKKIYWLNRYFKRVEKLFDKVHGKWLELSIRFYDSDSHIKLTKLKNKIYLRMQVLVRYSSILTNKAMIEFKQ